MLGPEAFDAVPFLDLLTEYGSPWGRKDLLDSDPPPQEAEPWRTSPDLLPHLAGRLFLTDGGLETDLIFLRGIDLPEFASFPLLDDADQAGGAARTTSATTCASGPNPALGMVLESPTWRASQRVGRAARLRRRAAWPT